MKQLIGFILIIVTVISLIAIYAYIYKSGKYKGDMVGLCVDSWEVIGLSVAIILVGIVLSFEIFSIRN
jgi:hypothetical protein